MSDQLLTSFLIAAFFIFQSCNDKPASDKTEEAKSGPPVTSISALIIKPTNLDRIINLTGSIIANEEVELRCESPGKITGIYFEEGSEVAKNQLLLKINDSDLKSQYRKLVLQDSLLTTDEFRKKKLLEMNAISLEEYDVVLTSLLSNRAEKDFIRSQIEKTEVRAPYSGYVGLRYVSLGGFVNASTIIATLQQVSPIKIEFSVPERYRAFLNNGSEIQFTITGTGEVFKGRVYAIEAKIDPATRTVKARAIHDNKERKLVPGAFAKVELVLERMENSIMVPAEAIVPELNGQKIFQIKNGTSKAVNVELGIRQDKATEVINGIAIGDTIALTGLLQLRDGTPVSIEKIN